jgi:mRNA interferase MazF
MRRGEVWTAPGGKDYAGKPRPVVIVQSDAFDATESVTVCGLTTNPTEAPLARPVIEPNETNGLKVTYRLGHAPPNGRQDHHNAKSEAR